MRGVFTKLLSYAVIKSRWLRNYRVKYVLTERTKLPWPSYDHVLPDGSRSTDPNAHYRPLIEADIGIQGWDWDWSTNYSSAMFYDIFDSDDVNITVYTRPGDPGTRSLSALILMYT